ncbi:Os05g0148800 [Oryza sativa Japonica Group]|jgi:hypothetical protein|uniref:Os05g0148800 protein n=1 Tax=Oryza sativa subsp. japonica TaxID=39947 RepID=A0A0P0WHX7_ORYSJ|nr:hypothetical protein EE612_027106 [Oryza sativa]BAS92277.1 Os05g0148800 [Oryza sativa Japonica Group]
MGVRVTGPAGSPLVAAVLASLEEAAAGGGYELVGTAAAREQSTRPHLARNVSRPPFLRISFKNLFNFKNKSTKLIFNI